jgi:hypothetical protein
MVWRRRNIERVRLGIIADRNCVLEFSGLSMPFLRSVVLKIAVRSFENCSPQLWL